MAEPEPGPDLDREAKIAEHEFRNREIVVKEAAQRTAEQDLAFRKEKAARSRWRSPLVVAIFAATVAALGNAVVAFVTGYQGQQLETNRAESARILEMIKTGDPDKAAQNLAFLADAGLIEDAHRLAAIRLFLANRHSGSGPSLPAATSDAAVAAQIQKQMIADAPAQAEERAKIQTELKNIMSKPITAPNGLQKPPFPARTDSYSRP